MKTNPKEIAAIFEKSVIEGSQVSEPNRLYYIIEDFGTLLICRTSSGGSAVILPGPKIRPPIKTRGFFLKHYQNLDIQIGVNRTPSQGTIIELQDSFDHAFHCLISDLLNLGSSRGVDYNDTIDNWISFFRAARPFDRRREIGLWGELFTIKQLESSSLALRGWGGPSGSVYDFSFDDFYLEVKTAIGHSRHFFSDSQINRTNENVYFLSLIIKRDPLWGKTILEMIESMDKDVDQAELYRVINVLDLETERSEYIRYSLDAIPIVVPIDTMPQVELGPEILSAKFEIDFRSLNVNSENIPFVLKSVA